jgi:hypothetical protein
LPSGSGSGAEPSARQCVSSVQEGDKVGQRGAFGKNRAEISPNISISYRDALSPTESCPEGSQGRVLVPPPRLFKGRTNEKRQRKLERE